MATVENQHGSRQLGIPQRRTLAYSTTAFVALSAATIGYVTTDSPNQNLALASASALRPKSDCTLRELLMHDLKQLDRSLADLRFALTWQNTPDAPSADYGHFMVDQALHDFKWLKTVSDRKDYHPALQPVFDAWQKALADIDYFNHAVRSGVKVTQDDELNFLLGCGTIKGALSQVERGAIRAPNRRRPDQPIIMNVTEEPVSGEITINHSISNVLWKLWRLQQEDRWKLNIGITNSESGKVIKLTAENHPSYKDPVLHAVFRNTLEIDGQESFIDMAMRQTTERFNATRTGLGWSNSGSVTVRNRMTEEAPVKPGLSISQYDFCLFISANPENSDQTRLRVTVSSELTFYDKVGRNFADTGYRANARRKSEVRLNERRDGALKRAAELFSAVVEGGAEPLKAIEMPDCERM